MLKVYGEVDKVAMMIMMMRKTVVMGNVEIEKEEWS